MISIQNVPEIFYPDGFYQDDLFIYDYKMTGDVIKSKINLDVNMLSFLQKGKKKVHFSNTSVGVNANQSLIIKSGNCLWTEILDNEDIYYCKLLFFSDKKIQDFLSKYQPVFTHKNNSPSVPHSSSYFIIENDDYIKAFVQSLSSLLNNNNQAATKKIVELKFEEIMLYLLNKYENSFLDFLTSILSSKLNATFKKIVETNAYANLSLDEIAFLCNMSLSTFKRHFIKEYKQTPAKWMQKLRLNRAKHRLENNSENASDIYLDLGYNNLSNFSLAFKNEFGVSPRQVKVKNIDNSKNELLS